MRTEVKTVSRLEFTPVPPELTELCLVPMPPLQPNGRMAIADGPTYAAEVLGILEECNTKLLKIERLMDRSKDK